jgi:ABC-2 type transport system permease protein
LFVAAVAGGFAITFLINALLGSLALFMESSVRLVDVYLLMFFVGSGYLVPVELFPPWARAILDALPFRYQIGLPVEIMVSIHDRSAASFLLGRQLGWVAALTVLTLFAFHRGVRRFGAFGG